MLLCASTAAYAEHEATFASWNKVDAAAVTDVRGWKLAGSDFTDVLIGRFPDRTYTMASVVLLHCKGDACTGRRVNFGASDRVDVLGVVDLDGEPTKLPSWR